MPKSIAIDKIGSQDSTKSTNVNSELLTLALEIPILNTKAYIRRRGNLQPKN